MALDSLVICEHCDAVCKRAPLCPGQVASCPRCDAELYRGRRFDLDTMLALTLASLLVFVIANVYPIITVELSGQHSASTLWGAIVFISHTGIAPVAILAAATIFLFPLLQIVVLLYVLTPLHWRRRPQFFLLAMHVLQRIRRWSMVEVFMLGVLVSIVKLTETMVVAPQVGLWAYAALTCLLTALSSFDLHGLWDLGSELDA